MYISELSDGARCQKAVETPVFDKNYDVIICGLGTSGGMAAIFAAENGLSVLGIEAFNCVGGTTTIGGVDGHYFSIRGGRCVLVDEAVSEFEKSHTHNPMEARKLVEEEQIVKSGATVLYESSVIGVYLEEKTVVGVRVITPDGIKNFASRFLFDCTGDAVVAHMAGCATEYGREVDGLVQPYSMVSSVFNDEKYFATNCDFGRVDQRNDKSLSEALIFSRAYEMKEEKAGFSRLFHMPLIGVREGRRIVAEETISLQDFFDGKRTEEPAFYAYADLDKHGWDIAFDSETLCDWSIGANLGAYNVKIPVSFRTIIPKDIDGLLVPCRALGVDRDVASCVRMVPNMQKLAEISADMAMLAKKHSCSLREIPYDELKERLEKSGCLNNCYDSDYRIDGVKNPEDVYFTDNPAELQAGLVTETPGQAIWSAKLMGDKAKETLIGLLTSEDDNTRKHAAFALAIMGDASGVMILREMAENRDALMLSDCRKHNQQRGCMAIYFLGRLADKGAINTLIDIITNPEETKREAYASGAQGTRYAISDFNNAYFQFMSNAVMALIRIGKAYPDTRTTIKKAFYEAFDDDTYYTRLTTRPKMSSEGGMAENIKNVAYKAVENW
ncbi:MAG: FAD-dependent oxidoreductase [Clostridia bacterium]|nr:FAD-dependent oxidoreductase [Clostridia bacterium]